MITNNYLQEIHHIKNMMEKSSRFISLSAYSGISAGVIGLLSATSLIVKFPILISATTIGMDNLSAFQQQDILMYIFISALLTFAIAFFTAFFFIYRKSLQTGVSVWSAVSLRMFWSIAIPVCSGAIFIIRCLQLNYLTIVIPASLIFYGLALVNASRFTYREIKYLGFGLLILGISNLWLPYYGIFFWTAGFGILHIMAGIIIWNKYERTTMPLK